MASILNGLEKGAWSRIAGHLSGPWTWDETKGRGKFVRAGRSPGTEEMIDLGIQHNSPDVKVGILVRFVEGGEWELVIEEKL